MTLVQRKDLVSLPLRYAAGTVMEDVYIHDPHTFAEASTRNVARSHSQTREERAICLATRKRSETSKTEDTETFCLETIRPLGLHAALNLQEADKMANVAGKRNLCMRV